MMERNIPGQSGADLEIPEIQTIRSKEGVNRLKNPGEVTTVHLSHQKATEIASIAALLEACPNLTTISIVPSLAESKLSSAAKEILGEKNIAIQVERFRDSPYYDSTPLRNHEDKKRVYEEMLSNPDKGRERQLFFLLEEYSIMEPKMLRMYCEKEMSIGKIAEKMGLKYFEVQRQTAALLHLIGYPSSNREILGKSKVWLRELKKTAEKEAWQEHYQVGEIPPPEKLNRTQWKMWQKIMQLRRDNPKRWSWLEENYPKHYQLLTTYFQFDKARGKKTTFRQLSNQLGVIHQKVHELKNDAIKLLFLEE